MSLLQLEGLSAGYRGVPVVRDINLVVNQGEIVALLGPNGAGKSTTLMTLSGLLDPLGGRIMFDGQSIAGMRPDAIARRGLVQVPEDRALFTQLTVMENIRLGGSSKRAVIRSLDYFPALTRLADRRAGVLSGGEQQMLALARAIAAQPQLLLVDEMSLGLAPVIVERLVPILRRAADELGASVLFVEQHVALALAVSDRAYVLTHGRIGLEGPAAELRERRELLAASYLGESAA
jgi:branched-chain amino acid transport system ATP-binding protein